MKCSEVGIILQPEDAIKAGSARLRKEDDDFITTQEAAEAYLGPTFVENNTDTVDLHLVYRDGMACVNFVNEDGVRINYDYPIETLKRVHHKANKFHSVKQS